MERSTIASAMSLRQQKSARCNVESCNVGGPDKLLELKRDYEVIHANIFRTYDYHTVTSALDLDNECRVTIACLFSFSIFL